jgi:hypothetical protein
LSEGLLGGVHVLSNLLEVLAIPTEHLLEVVVNGLLAQVLVRVDHRDCLVELLHVLGGSHGDVVLDHDLVELLSDLERVGALADLELELGVDLLWLGVGLVAFDHVDEVELEELVNHVPVGVAIFSHDALVQ